MKHCECRDRAAPFVRAELTHEEVEALLAEWGEIPMEPPADVCKNCRLPIAPPEEE